MTKKKLQDPRVYEGQMMEPKIYHRGRVEGKIIIPGVRLSPRQVKKLYDATKPSPDLVVTISGQTGTGKTTLARIISAALTLGGHPYYRWSHNGVTGQNFRPGTDIEAHGDFRTVMIVEATE